MGKKNNIWVHSFIGSIVVTLGWDNDLTYNQMYKNFKTLQAKKSSIRDGTITEVIEDVAKILNLNISEEYKKTTVLVYDSKGIHHPIVTKLASNILLPLSREGNYLGVLAQEDFEVVEDLWDEK